MKTDPKPSAWFLRAAAWTRMAAILILAPLAGAAYGAELDPKDGPDVDLRILVEDDEVRFQIITNLAFLDATTEAYREVPDELAPPEAGAAMEALFELFRTKNLVEIDGTPVQPLRPTLEADFRYDRGDPALFQHFVRFGARAVVKTQITLRYPCKSPPRQVAVTWGVWPENEVLREEGQTDEEVEKITILCRFAAGGVDRVVTFRSPEPQYIWHREAEAGRKRFEEVPAIREQEDAPRPIGLIAGLVAAVALTLFGPRALRRGLFGPAALILIALLALRLSSRGVQPPTPEEAVVIFEPLHENIYRAFDYTDESAVYDALRESVDGELLATLYDDVYRSLVLQEEGGAVSKVTSVRHTSIDVIEVGMVGPLERPGFRVNCLWEVDGAVYHWGHAHTRTNEYRALYTVHAADEGWRIAASQPLEQQRLNATPLDDIDLGNADRWESAVKGEAPQPDKDESLDY